MDEVIRIARHEIPDHEILSAAQQIIEDYK